MKICSYCRLEECKCGAKDYIDKPIETAWIVGQPFAYLGYVVWNMHDGMVDQSHIFRFYKGIELIGDVKVTTKEVIDAGIKIDECTDNPEIMEYIFEKMERECLAHTGRT